MKIIEWIKSYWNKKPVDVKEQLSDTELLQKKKAFQTRKQAINDFLNLKDNQLELSSIALDVLEDIDTAMINLQRFDKYDLTNPCMTYEEYRKVVLDKCATQIADMGVYAGDDIMWMNAVDIPIEVLVYYAAREPYLQRLLNKCDDVEYQRYCGMFKNDIVVFLFDLGFKSMFD